MGIIKTLWAFFLESPKLQGLFLVVATALLRAFMHMKKTSWKLKLAEMGMCALLYIGATVLQIVFQWPAQVAIGIGVLIGFVGSDQIRAFIVRFGNTKAEATI